MDFPNDPCILSKIDEYVRNTAKRLKRYKILISETEDDLFQDLYVHVLKCWENYDQEKGTIDHFIWCVLKRRSLNILRDCCRKKAPKSFLRATFSEDDYQDEHYPQAFDDILLTIDVQKRLRRLPSDTRQFAENLKKDSPSKAARNMHLTRKQFNQQREQIRHCLSNLHKQTQEVFMDISLSFLDESSIQEVCALPINDLQALSARLKEAIDAGSKEASFERSDEITVRRHS
jgi:RNA polymerase sigma factor (sigma-70 family)